MIKRAATCVQLVLLICAGTGAAPGQTVYKIEGVVYGPESKPIPNVLVVLENHARAQIGQEITNSDGRYQFVGILAGTYYVFVKPDESQFRPVIQMVELINTSIGGNSISTERVDFSLKAAVRPKQGAAPAAIFAQAVPPEADKEYLEGMKVLKKGDKSEAIKHFTKAIEVFPTCFLALQQLGLLYVEVTKYQEAVPVLRKAVVVNSKGAEAHLGLGMAYVNLDQLPAAIEELNIARSIDPRLFRTYLYLGMAFIGVDNLEAAEENLKHAYTLGGPIEGRSAHLYLASIYDKRKQYQKAIEELEAYLRDNPKAPNTTKIKEAIQKLKAKS
jgi:tetratricopeptide (TPR) repeat protein